MYLLTNPQRVKSVNDLMPMIGEYHTAIEKDQSSSVFTSVVDLHFLDNSCTQRTHTVPIFYFFLLLKLKEKQKLRRRRYIFSHFCDFL